MNDDYLHLILDAAGLAANAKAGQFFNIACPATVQDMAYLRRPMSVYRVAPASGQVEFLYKVTGAGTRGLATLRTGDSVPILGPLGNGFTLDARWKNIVVLGRGVGLATLAPLAEMAAERGIGTTAILSARSRAVVMSVDRFVNAGASVEVVTDEDGSSDPDNVERLLLRLIESGKADAFFTCGSNRLMLLMKRLARVVPYLRAGRDGAANGLRLGHVLLLRAQLRVRRPHREQRRVCFEGPVFELAEALSW